MLVLGRIADRLDALTAKKGDQKLAISAALLMYCAADEDLRTWFRQQIVAIESDVISIFNARALNVEPRVPRELGDMNHELHVRIIREIALEQREEARLKQQERQKKPGRQKKKKVKKAIKRCDPVKPAGRPPKP